jgi:hypothetical protein
MSSLLTHVTVLFTGTVRVSGLKVKLSIFTSIGADLVSSPFAGVGCEITTAARAKRATAKLTKNNFFLMIKFLLVVDCQAREPSASLQRSLARVAGQDMSHLHKPAPSGFIPSGLPFPVNRTAGIKRQWQWLLR